ncbi:MAG: ribbon-helix-helix protein, CopG family [Planctomycetes bacterium]|nr:ribbon-helix-helix protein, CopG family [Planctomycetota bacterium]MBM4080098.1 ribbon-helix-helix protein, CopG family [Planctomycetota bacterium]
MSELSLKVPQTFMAQLEKLAAKRNKSVEQLILEYLASLLQPPPKLLQERYDRFLAESGLFVQMTEADKRRYAAASEDEREELARKFGQGTPLSQTIMEDRGQPRPTR